MTSLIDIRTVVDRHTAIGFQQRLNETSTDLPVQRQDIGCHHGETNQSMPMAESNQSNQTIRMAPTALHPTCRVVPSPAQKKPSITKD